jgi:UDP-glucuronate decarboxylase
VNGDGTSKRSYMYAADLAIWLWTILLRGPANQVFNVGSDQAISILKLAHAVAAAIGSPAAVRVAQRVSAGAEAQQYVPSISKAQRDLGLKCEVALEDAIRRTVAWHGYPTVLS